MATDIDTFLTDLALTNPEQHQTISTLYSVISKFAPNLEQGIKYGGICFFQDNSLIAGIFPYKKHSSLELSKGAQFTDPQSLLAGSGKLRRHLKFVAIADIDESSIYEFISQAMSHG